MKNLLSLSAVRKSKSMKQIGRQSGEQCYGVLIDISLIQREVLLLIKLMFFPFTYIHDSHKSYPPFCQAFHEKKYNSVFFVNLF